MHVCVGPVTILQCCGSSATDIQTLGKASTVSLVSIPRLEKNRLWNLFLRPRMTREVWLLVNIHLQSWNCDALCFTSPGHCGLVLMSQVGTHSFYASNLTADLLVDTRIIRVIRFASWRQVALSSLKWRSRKRTGEDGMALMWDKESKHNISMHQSDPALGICVFMWVILQQPETRALSWKKNRGLRLRQGQTANSLFGNRLVCIQEFSELHFDL